MALDRQLTQAVVIAIGIVAGGALIGDGFARGHRVDRSVTVKGISEREAKADLAIWPLHITAADNDLGRANDKLQASSHHVLEFLGRNGLDTTAAALQDLEVTDALLESDASKPPPARYVLRETIVLRSTKPDQVAVASQHVADLVRAGVVLSSAGAAESGGPTFLFTGLNSLKPQMIAEATARAREAAEQFARDSKTEIGGIRQASQGVFEILPHDQAPGISEESQILKTVRVVSTIDYSLR